MVKDLNFIEVLRIYEDRIQAEDKIMKSLTAGEGMQRRDEFLLSVGEDAAVFMNTLVKSANAKIILEIGTSYGYSTLWLAEAARENGGLVITLEADEAKVTYAKDKLKQAGLLKYVDFRVGDALNLIEKAEEHFDFVLVDIWKDLYLPCFELFYPKLNDKAWVLADNMIFPPQSNEVTQLYQNRIRQTENFSSVLLPIGSGIELSQYELKTV
ncbi:class I SAM-dependent methyltransferase [Flavobacteriaceae bacterium]|nr:class I SAM-dependent methyltransferase [Flavobacteriaceae bacterium]MDB9941575.1 class I SAM-dependent methyltransferase [Flavobacteriaceae bacterium]MDC1434113.1 class I SAM-dependent methyltransferase [Flavobacteriaceae bacterium]